MQSRSVISGAWLQRLCAAAFVLALAPSAFANGNDDCPEGGRTRDDNFQTTTENKCVTDPATGPVKRRTECRRKTNNNFTETRTRDKQNGEVQGALATYRFNFDNVTVTRVPTGTASSKFIIRNDERGISQNPSVPSWFFTSRQEVMTTPGGTAHNRCKERCRCKSDDPAAPAACPDTDACPEENEGLNVLNGALS